MNRTQSPSILLVDDNPVLGVCLQGKLSEAGFTIVQASNGAQALERLSGGLTPDAIIVDLHMPEVNGWEFLSQLSKSGYPRERVLVWTAGVSRKLALLDHCWEVLPKDEVLSNAPKLIELLRSAFASCQLHKASATKNGVQAAG